MLSVPDPTEANMYPSPEGKQYLTTASSSPPPFSQTLTASPPPLEPSSSEIALIRTQVPSLQGMSEDDIKRIMKVSMGGSLMKMEQMNRRLEKLHVEKEEYLFSILFDFD